MLTATTAVMLCMVAQAAVTDLAIRKIPNRLILAGLLLALILHLLAGPRWAPLTAWLGGALAGLLLFLPPYMARGMAAGDVKLMAMVGAFTGPLLALQIGLVTYLIGGLMALVMMWRSGKLRVGLRNSWRLCQPLLLRLLGMPLVPVPLPPATSVGSMPYGLAIACGTVTVLAWTHR